MDAPYESVHLTLLVSHDRAARPRGVPGVVEAQIVEHE
jgi:hypothetical protein